MFSSDMLGDQRRYFDAQRHMFLFVGWLQGGGDLLAASNGDMGISSIIIDDVNRIDTPSITVTLARPARILH
jgi:hypothetical protein